MDVRLQKFLSILKFNKDKADYFNKDDFLFSLSVFAAQEGDYELEINCLHEMGIIINLAEDKCLADK
ncbi:hypothetical protein [Serratia quinivorans]|uniref:hypothetical protein n=1 Tax=Serratia quinivorans TaxID=137545 RepID=UPI002E79037A|nr:hypothetical protein [Serratia quinivorans]